jgi:putative DNA primase/helicase
VTDNTAEVVDETVQAMCTADVFDGGGRLVRVLPFGQVQTLSGAGLLDEVSRVASYKRGKKTLTRAPQEVVAALMDRGAWPGLRRLNGVSSIPVLREDGSLHDQQGYDRETGVWFCGNAMRVGTTRGEASEAMVRLLEATTHSWFQSNDDRMAWVAHVITHVVRPTIKGAVPCWVYSANEQGCGKTALAQAAAWIATGVETPAIMAKIDTDEWTKTLFTYADSPALLVDNVRGTIASVELEQAITSGALTVRRMHTQAPETRAWRPIVALTSNGAALGKDMARRTIPVRLEKTEAGAQYRGALIDGWSREQMAADALTIVRAYIMNGEDVSVKPWTSFGGWSRYVAEAIAWLGMGDIVEARMDGLCEMNVDEEDHEHVHAAIWAWRQDRTFTVAEITGNGSENSIAFKDLQAAFRALLGVGLYDALKSKQVGKRLGMLGVSRYGRLISHRAADARHWRLVPPE